VLIAIAHFGQLALAHPKTSAHIGLMSWAFGKIPLYLFTIVLLLKSFLVLYSKTGDYAGIGCSVHESNLSKKIDACVSEIFSNAKIELLT
jgi:hypothetical protein